MQNIKQILPNLSASDLDQEQITKLNQLFIQQSDIEQPQIKKYKPLNEQNPSKTLLDLISPSQSHPPFAASHSQGSSCNSISEFNFFPSSPSPINSLALLSTLQAQQKHREKIYQTQIQSLREELQTVHKHLDEVNAKYQEKRQEANTFMAKYLQIREQYEDALQKIKTIVGQNQRKQLQMLKIMQQRISELQQQHKIQIQNLSSTLFHTQACLSSTKQSFFKASISLQQLQSQNAELSSKLAVISQSLDQEKMKNIGMVSQMENKDKKMVEMGKCMREMGKRLANVEMEAKKEVLKEKAKAKRAWEGLEMGRKIWGFDLERSKKKEKEHWKKEKELIGKIKQMEVQQEKQISRSISNSKLLTKSRSVTNSSNLNLHMNLNLNSTINKHNNQKSFLNTTALDIGNYSSNPHSSKNSARYSTSNLNPKNIDISLNQTQKIVHGIQNQSLSPNSIQIQILTPNSNAVKQEKEQQNHNINNISQEGENQHQPFTSNFYVESEKLCHYEEEKTRDKVKEIGLDSYSPIHTKRLQHNYSCNADYNHEKAVATHRNIDKKSIHAKFHKNSSSQNLSLKNTQDTKKSTKISLCLSNLNKQGKGNKQKQKEKTKQIQKRYVKKYENMIEIPEISDFDLYGNADKLEEFGHGKSGNVGTPCFQSKKLDNFKTNNYQSKNQNFNQRRYSANINFNFNHAK